VCVSLQLQAKADHDGRAGECETAIFRQVRAGDVEPEGDVESVAREMILETYESRARD
jgi:hypothetical protein